MDNLLIVVTLALLVAMLFWMAQARRWRAKAKEHERAAIGMACDLSRVGKDSWEAGYVQAAKVASGGLYLAAMRANADETVLTALRVQGRRLLGEPADLAISSLETRAAE